MRIDHGGVLQGARQEKQEEDRMGRLKVNESKNGFLLEDKPFFYLGDTIWSAFTNVTMEEWEYYLKKRKEQGFTVLQINTMPQWDRCMSDTGLYPFATEDEGQTFDYSKWNDRYYENAASMCRMAVDKGFQLALVVLWLNYVPGTWGSKMMDRNVMPKGFIREYTEKIVKIFDRFQPIYVVSGDTDFDTPESVEYYRIALQTICEKSPDSLKTMHIRRGYDVIPEEFLTNMDFYMFQSGHNRDGQEMAYQLPVKIREKYPKKPMINAEPCYEQMGYSRKLYGRFRAEALRKAAWHSLLSGACAGVTYGAHGIWNWQKINKKKNSILGEGFDASFPWEEAIQFPGAWDYGWIRHFLEAGKIEELIPSNELLVNNTEEIRMAVTPDGRYLIYVPYSTRVVIGKELPGCQVQAVDLETKRCAWIEYHTREGQTVIEMHPFNNDALLTVEFS